MIIVSGGIKGGTGKTTIAANLGIERARSSKRVILVDADPDQESLTDYIGNRDQQGNTPSVPIVQAKGSTTAKSILALAKDYDDVIVDCGGFDSQELRQAVLVSSIWIVPLNPTQLQVWTMPKVKELLDSASALRPEPIEVRLLGMRVATNPYAKPRDELQRVAADLDGFKVLKTLVHQRVAFEKAEGLGLAVTEIEKPSESERKARDAIRGLYREVWGSE